MAFVGLGLLGLAPSPAAKPNEVQNLADLSLEQLMDETVTSVSKREQRRGDVAAAISVLSNDDLRRSGATSIPDALRLVPGMNVASVNAHEWAISARGHNGAYANKLLVLVDGRVVYTPTFGGVFWDLQQPLLEDIDRIEVIRGPGATIWGANAVNGVINVTTRAAKDTPGTLLYGGGGDYLHALGGARYGGKLGADTYYRVFTGYKRHDDFPTFTGQRGQDNWEAGTFGYRLDHYLSDDTQLTWQGDATGINIDDATSDAYNLNTLGRWTHKISERSSLQAQLYYDRNSRDDKSRAGMVSDTFDFTAQHSFGLGEHNDVIWGFGAQYYQNTFEQLNFGILTLDNYTHAEFFNIFVQDEFRVIPEHLTLTAGAKLEHNTYTGFEVEPSVRAAFKPTASQTFWAAISRAVRTPTVVLTENVFATAISAPFIGPGGQPYITRIVGNPAAESEVVWAYEFGYRVQISERVSFDAAAFYNDYDDLLAPDQANVQFIPSGIPGVPGIAAVLLQNISSSKNYGGELAVTVSPGNGWRLTGTYSLLLTDTPDALLEASAPVHSATLRSSHDIGAKTTLDLQLRYVDNIAFVPSYLTADFRLAYRLTDRLELSLVGQNLLDSQHPEQAMGFFTTVSEVPRSFFGKLTWRF